MCIHSGWHDFSSHFTGQKGPNINTKLPKGRWVVRRKAVNGRHAQLWRRGSERGNDVILGGCHHYASGVLNCCTDRQQRMNALMWPKETARNSIYTSHSSNIGPWVDVKPIKNCGDNTARRDKDLCLWAIDETYQAKPLSFYRAHRKQQNTASLNWEPEALTDE